MLRVLVALLAVMTLGGTHAGAKERSAPARIVAIGDLHGDFQAWRTIATGAGLIDARGRWSGGRTVLVQLGDIVDRGPDSLPIIRDLMRLEREARRAGGEVVVVIGNHEAMMMTDDLRYVHPGEYAAFAGPDSAAIRAHAYAANRRAIETAARTRDPAKTDERIAADWMAEWPLGKIEHRRAWAPTGELGRWTLRNRAVVRIGDSLFVHGGISLTYASQSLERINREVAEALARGDQQERAIINDPLGPLWYRGLVERSPSDPPLPPPEPEAGSIQRGTPVEAVRPSIPEEIALVRRAYGVRRIVIGHTPSRAGIIGNADGSLWRIDSGNAEAYGGRPSWLEIVGERVTAHQVARP